MSDPDDLLKRAEELPALRRTKQVPRADEVALAVGYCRGRYSGRQVAHAAKLGANGNEFAWVGSVLIRAVRFGMLTETTAGNEETNSG